MALRFEESRNPWMALTSPTPAGGAFNAFCVGAAMIAPAVVFSLRANSLEARKTSSSMSLLVQAMWRRRTAWRSRRVLASLKLEPSLMSSSAIRLILTVSLFALLPGLGLAEDSELQPEPKVRPSRLRHIVLKPEESRFRLLPLTNYVNTAFDTAQVSRSFSQDDYWHNHERVFDRITHPLDSIDKDGGWDHLLRQELASAAILPNLTLHVLGNGYDFRALAEWYDEYGVPLPYFWAFLSSYAGYLGNEAIEVSNPEIDATDNIADLYFFNLLGNLLFMSDTVTDVVHNQWQLRNWPGQPAFDVRHRTILNASNNYVLRPDLWQEHLRPFLYFGLHYFAGASLALRNGTGVSVGAGLATVDPFTANYLDKIQASGGLFWDDHDRLLASVIFNGTDESIFRVNLYPDLLNFKTLDLGLFFGVAQHGVPTFGIAIEKLIAFGLS